MTDQNELKQSILANKIIFIALVFSQLAFAVVMYVIVSTGKSPLMQDLNDILLLIAIIFSFSTLFTGFYIYKMKMKEIDPEKPLLEKLKNHRIALILKFGIWESASFFSIVSFFLTSNYLFLIFIGLIILAYFADNPSIEKTAKDLKLSNDEKEELYKALGIRINF